MIRRSFRPLLVKAGLPTIRFHDLRHSVASLLLTAGTHPKIVQELLGHSQISITLDTYSHVLPTLQKEAVQHLNTLLSQGEDIEAKRDHGWERFPTSHTLVRSPSRHVLVRKGLC